MLEEALRDGFCFILLLRIIIQVMRMVTATQVAAAPIANPTTIKESFDGDGVEADAAHVPLLERHRNGFPSYLCGIKTCSSTTV
jgi:hypothetical protein